MIMALLVLKTRCKEFYEKNYRIVRSVLKIVISMILYSIILYQLPFSKELREYGIPLSVILALVSGFVPDSVIIFLAAMLAVLEISSVSYLLAACFLFVLLIYFLLFGPLLFDNLKCMLQLRIFFLGIGIFFLIFYRLIRVNSLFMDALAIWEIIFGCR